MRRVTENKAFAVSGQFGECFSLGEQDFNWIHRIVKKSTKTTEENGRMLVWNAKCDICGIFTLKDEQVNQPETDSTHEHGLNLKKWITVL